MLAAKIICALFIAVLVPVYWRRYGLANFLWFSDLGLFIGAAALWLESPLLASMQAVSVGLLEIMWNVDFFVHLFFRVRLVGIADYMFKDDQSLFVRGLSLFHVILPPGLFWMVWQFGYDSNAWLVQTVFAWAILLICFFFTKPADNINWAFGPGGQPQRRLAPGLYLVMLMSFLAVCIYLPSHLVLWALFG